MLLLLLVLADTVGILALPFTQKEVSLLSYLFVHSFVDTKILLCFCLQVLWPHIDHTGWQVPVPPASSTSKAVCGLKQPRTSAPRASQGSSPASRGLAEWMAIFTGALKQWPQDQPLDMISERTQMGQKRGGVHNGACRTVLNKLQATGTQLCGGIRMMAALAKGHSWMWEP